MIQLILLRDVLMKLGSQKQESQVQKLSTKGRWTIYILKIPDLKTFLIFARVTYRKQQ